MLHPEELFICTECFFFCHCHRLGLRSFIISFYLEKHFLIALTLFVYLNLNFEIMRLAVRISHPVRDPTRLPNSAACYMLASGMIVIIVSGTEIKPAQSPC